MKLVVWWQGLWIGAIVFVMGSVPAARADAGFDHWMGQFEAAKRTRDFPACEAALHQALRYGSTEYAVGSLVWSQMNQDKTDVALAAARQMEKQYGLTAYAVGSVMDASLREGDWRTAIDAAETAKRLGLANGEDWRNHMVKDLLAKVHDLVTPAVYRLKWTIPGSEFTAEHPARRFGFPLLKTGRQTFRYALTGAISSRVMQANERHNIVEITGTPGQSVVVSGQATIRPEAIGARELRRLAKIPLRAASPHETGVFYYWTEPFDPATPSIADTVKAVRRASAVETVQAVLDWRDRQMPYRVLLPGPGSTLDRIAAQQCGVCHDASYMSASLARANGIPAVVIGVDNLPASGSFADADTSHGHIRVKLPEIGWTSVEPLRRDSLQYFGGSNYLQFSIESDREEMDRISLQGYGVSGERLQ